MFTIALNKIYLSKGDTARFTISLASSIHIAGFAKSTPSDYVLSNEDDIYFIVTHCPEVVDLDDLETSENCVFYKKGVDIFITPEDTEDLGEKMYYYQVRVKLKGIGDIHTIIEPEELYLTPIGSVGDRI